MADDLFPERLIRIIQAPLDGQFQSILNQRNSSLVINTSYDRELSGFASIAAVTLSRTSQPTASGSNPAINPPERPILWPEYVFVT